MSNNYHGTGIEEFDSLIGLQMLVDSKYKETVDKMMHIRDIAGYIGVGNLLEKDFVMSVSELFFSSPSLSDDEMMRFRRGMFFEGKLLELAYLDIPEVPIDSMTLNFGSVELLDIADLDKPFFRLGSFRVPVLAIESAFKSP